jgi:hypothetical protein
MRNDKITYGYVALRPSDPGTCKSGSSDDPINRPENTWSDEPWIVAVAFIIGSRKVESEWKRLLAQYRVGTGGTEIFRTAPMWDYAMQQLADFRAQLSFKLPPSFEGPSSIPTVELGKVEQPPIISAAYVDRILPYSVAACEPPKSAYQRYAESKMK